MPADRNSGKDFSFPHIRLNIAGKLLLGYISVAAMTVVISTFSITTLERLNKISSSVINVDVPISEATDNMIDNLLAQERYGRRYAIIKSPDTLALFWEKNDRFKENVEILRHLEGLPEISVERLEKLHSEYSELFSKGSAYLSESSSPRAKRLNDDLKEKMDEMLVLIKGISVKARENQKGKVHIAADIGEKAFRIAWILSSFGLLLGLFFAIIITKNIAGAVNKLKVSTRLISEGKYDHISEVKNRDELGELGESFNKMAKRLKHLEAMNIDASPLTRLPGGMAIERVVENRLEADEPLVFCHFDMDNFKAYVDRYGYAKGSEVIKVVADIIEGVAEDNGGDNDFVGHIGGDDFVVLTTPDRYEDICKAVINKFDSTIPGYYNEADRSLGYIPGKTRQGEAMNFPIMTISISVVLNEEGKISNPFEFGEVAAELKEYAKSIAGSVYVVDKRKRVFHRAGNIEEKRTQS